MEDIKVKIFTKMQTRMLFITLVCKYVFIKCFTI